MMQKQESLTRYFQVKTSKPNSLKEASAEKETQALTQRHALVIAYRWLLANTHILLDQEVATAPELQELRQQLYAAMSPTFHSKRIYKQKTFQTFRSQTGMPWSIRIKSKRTPVRTKPIAYEICQCLLRRVHRLQQDSGLFSSQSDATFGCRRGCLVNSVSALVACCKGESTKDLAPFQLPDGDSNRELAATPSRFLRQLALVELPHMSYEQLPHDDLHVVQILDEQRRMQKKTAGSTPGIEAILKNYFEDHKDGALNLQWVQAQMKDKQVDISQAVDSVMAVFKKFLTFFNLDRTGWLGCQQAAIALCAHKFAERFKTLPLTHWATRIRVLPSFVPAKEVYALDTLAMEEIPLHVREQAEIDITESKHQATLHAPVVCQLCHVGLSSVHALFRRVSQKHCNWAEYRKRILFMAQKRGLVPLLPWAKRQMLQNFSTFEQFSIPGSGTNDFSEKFAEQAEVRTEIACAICAVRDWPEHRYKCFMFLELDEHQTEEVINGQEDDEDADHTTPRSHEQTLLRRGGCFCFGPAEKIDKFLSTERYKELMPHIPKDDLEYSSVCHPFYSYRWLAHTRRIPMLTPNTAGSKISCASARTGDPHRTVNLCELCRKHLCKHEPTLPPLALANLFWLGRLHPLYKQLSLGEEMLLGLGRACYRKIMLGKTKQDESYSGLQGNTILLAQASPKVSQVLPPDTTELQETLVVAYCKSIDEIHASQMFTVSRDKFIKCAEYRKTVNPAFFDATISADDLPEHGVPESILACALPLPEVENIRATMDGPAKRQSLFSSGLDTEDAELAEVDETEDTSGQTATISHECTQVDEDGLGQVLIGLDPAQDPEPARLFSALKFKLDSLEKEGTKLAASQRKPDMDSENMTFQADIAAQTWKCRKIAVDAQTILNKLKTVDPAKYERQLLDAEEPKVLAVPSGKPLNMYDPSTWSKCFVHFLYGDCAPNLAARPNKKVTLQQLFASLLNREELQYDLPSDLEKYIAPCKSRFDSATMICVFADCLRRLRTLQAVRASFARKGFEQDMRNIAKVAADEFFQWATKLGDGGASKEPEGGSRIAAAMRHLQFASSMVPLTNGYRQMNRHIGTAMNILWGPLLLFCTINLADSYHPVVLHLYNSTTDTKEGSLQLDAAYLEHLASTEPAMPTLQTMRKICSSSPRSAAKFWLLLHDLILRHLFGIASAQLGHYRIQSPLGLLAKHQEDDFASSTSIGLAGFCTAMLGPLEDQGRGFVHAHFKLYGVPNGLEDVFRKVFENPAAFVEQSRKKLEQCAATLQYDSAVEPGVQLGQDMPVEPFSIKQQSQSRMDGGLEVDGSMRDQVPLAPHEPLKHVQAELAAAQAESRPSRDLYREVPLTGNQLSTFPAYRLPFAFAVARGNLIETEC